MADLSEDLRYRNVMAFKRKKAGKRQVELQVWSVECVACGTTSGKATYCSDACRMKAYWEWQK